MSKKIISVFLIFAISLSMFAMPVHAAEGKSITVSSTGSFWQMVANSNSDFMQYLMGTLSNSIFGNGTVCPSSPDAKHYGSPAGAGRDQRVVTCRCKYCGELFTVDDSVIESAYQDYVGGLDDPNASYGEGYVDFTATQTIYKDTSLCTSPNKYSYAFGTYAFQPLFNASDKIDGGSGGGDYTFSIADLLLSLGIQDRVAIVAIQASEPYDLYGYYWNEYGRLVRGRFENSSGYPFASCFGVYDLSALSLVGHADLPLYCSRSLACLDPSFLRSNSYLFNKSSYFCAASSSSNVLATVGVYVKSSSETEFSTSRSEVSVVTALGGNVFYTSVDSAGTSSNNYSFYFASSAKFSSEYLVHGPAGTNSSSRPGSITGDYGVIGDNNTITNIGSQVIINESDLTYTNPATGETSSIESWQYAYGSRKYTIVTGDGNTVTVTYGDENVTIVEGDVVYNIYYMVDSSGENPACKHSYTHTVLSPASCKVSGLDQYKCELCGHTYQAATSATGHTWKILRDVNTSYDESGALIQEGYTIYECEICGEQYKSTDGAAPPSGNNGSSGGSSGSGSGSGDSSGGGIFDKIGELLGTLGGGLVDAIGKAVEFLLDSLLRLVRVVVDKGVQLVDLILSFFERIPDMFGAFPQFLAAVFPFIPEDVMIILEFGLAAVVVLGIIKILRK